MLCRLPLCLLILAVIWQCASYTDETAEVRQNFYKGDFQLALEKLEKSPLKDSSRNLLLFQLEKAMIFDRLGDRQQSRKLLIAADRQVDKLYTTSILNTASSFLINDSTQDYGGEDYEKVAIHTMLALSFLQDKSLEEAGVEARKINLILDKITKEYAQKFNGYREDALALYLSALIHEAQREDDDAIIDYQKALTTFAHPHYRQFYLGAVPDHLVRALYLLAGKNQRSELKEQLKETYPDIVKTAEEGLKAGLTSQIVSIHEIGHIAIKRANDFVIPLGGQIIRLSFPYIAYNERYSFGTTGLDLEGEGFFPGRNLAYLSAIAHFALEERRGRMILKSAARLIAKAALTNKAYDAFGPLGGIAANVASAVTETADTRGWTLLPDAFSVSRAWLKPGKHRMKLMSEGRLDKVEMVETSAGKIAIFRSY